MSPNNSKIFSEEEILRRKDSRVFFIQAIGHKKSPTNIVSDNRALRRKNTLLLFGTTKIGIIFKSANFLLENQLLLLIF
nr:MAG TPA: hypothetical protein [Caudoviricetes sp.]